jgi:hypothetical protein
MKSINRIACGLGVVAALLAGSAGASVTVGATRVVYPLENREVTVKLNAGSPIRCRRKMRKLIARGICRCSRIACWGAKRWRAGSVV